MRFVEGFFRFWWDFVVGDDWKIAAAVGTTLVVFSVVAGQTRAGASWLAPIAGAALVCAFVVALTVDVRKR